MTDDLPEPVRERIRPDYWYTRANIPQNMQSIDFDRFEDTALEAASEVAFDLVDAWVNHDGYRGISLFGRPGCGKTTLVATMLCAYIEVARPRTINGMFDDAVKGYFITLADYHRLYLKLYELDRWAKQAPSGSDDAYSEWERNFLLRRFIEEEVPHLVIDDVGNEHQTKSGAVQDEFHALIRGRYSRGLSTSVTSNLSRDKFVEIYGEPQLSFLAESTRVFNIKGARDRRITRVR